MDVAPDFPPRLAQSLEETLARERDFTQAILDTAQGLICCFDVDGRVFIFNRACQALFGYTEKEVFGRFLWEIFIPPEHAEDRRRRFKMLQQGNISGGFEATWLTKNKEAKLIAWQTAILRDKAGQIIGVVATGVDITDRRKAELALAREQAFHRAVLDELPDALVACDEGGVLKFFNRRAVEFHNLADEPLKSDRWAKRYDLHHPDGRVMEPKDVPLFKALRGERVRDCEMVIAPPERRARFVLCSGDPLYDSGGHLIGAVVQMHDDTERRAAEQFLRQSERRLREQNLQLECLFGLAREFTQTLSRPHLAQSLDAASKRIAELLGADSCRVLFDGQPADPPQGAARITVPLEDHGKHFGEVEVTQAAPRNWKESERRWLEAVADLVSNAVERVGLVEDLGVQREKALQASVAKTRFLANMSHEIRTPLNGVLGLVQLLLRAEDLPEQHLNTLQMARECGAHLIALVNDILDLSRIEAGRLEFSMAPADLKRLLEDLAGVFMASAREKGLGFYVRMDDSCPTDTITDERRLRQILFNLIGNAIKFTATGEVRLDARGDDGTIRISITDTGAGIEPDVLARLFQPFERGTASNASPGTGLGLAISSRFAEGLGGRVEASSTPGSGSTFTLILPHRPTGAVSEQARAEQLDLQVESDVPLPWADVSALSPAFLNQVDEELCPALLSGDLSEILDAAGRLRSSTAGAADEAFLAEVQKRAEAFEIASLYPLAGRIRERRNA